MHVMSKITRKQFQLLVFYALQRSIDAQEEYQASLTALRTDFHYHHLLLTVGESFIFVKSFIASVAFNGPDRLISRYVMAKA